VLAVALLSAAGASGGPGDSYTAASTPTDVKPSSSTAFTIQLKNDAATPDRAQRARIGIATGFVVAAPSVTAATSAAGTCVASTWVADGALIADGRINLRRPGGGPPSELCPGAVLTVTFTATAPASDSVGAWTTELLRTEAFALVGSQPGVRVDGRAPTTTITSAPTSPTNSGSAGFAFKSDEPTATFECALDGGALAPCASPTAFTGLPEGAHAFRVRATDRAGNVEQTAALHSWVVDVTPPDTSVSSGPPSRTNSTFGALGLHATEPGSTFECSLDGGAFQSCASPKTYDALAEGAHTFRARATDPAGNTDPTPSQYAWTIDTTPPATSISGGPPQLAAGNSAQFTFAATEAASFECRLDGLPFGPCSSPASYLAVPDGTHLFEVRAEDLAGNVDATAAAYAWTVDTDPPATIITSAPFDPSNVATATFGFTASEPVTLFECSLDGAAFAPCTSPRGYTDLADGPHTFDVRARDTAGNTGAASRHAWSIGTQTPLTLIGARPPDPTSSTAAAIEFTTNVPGATFECSLDGSGYTACTSPASYSQLANGTHRLLVRAIDADQKTGSPAGYAWSVDTVPPTVQIGLNPPALTNARSAAFTFTGETGSSFECQLDGGAFTTCASPISFSSLANGSHAFAVRAVDAAGNTSVAATFTWTVDIVEPTTSITAAPAGRTRSASASFSFTANEAGSTFECRLDAGPFATCVSPAAYPQLPDGRHVFEVRATDPAGNADATPTGHEWTVDTTAPQTSIVSGPPTLTKNVTASFTLASSEPGSTFECRLDGGAFTACPTTTTLSALAEAGHTFEVRAADDLGNTDSSPAAHSWTVDVSPPDTAITTRPADPTSSTAPAFAFASSEPSTFECRLDGGAFAACAAPTTYTGVTQGTHTFEVRATDGAGNVESTPAAYTWTVDATAPDTSIVSGPPNPTSSRAATFSFASNETAVTFECSLDGAAAATCSSPVELAGLNEGTHTFSVRAVDRAGNADATPATWTWAIDLTPPDTTIPTGPSDPTSDPSPTFTLASSQTGSTFECSLDGAAFAACTSPVVYGDLGEGAHTFRARAIDPAGNVDATPAQRAWRIDLTPPETTIGAAPPALVNAASATFGFTSNEAGSTFECSLDSGAFAACVSPVSYSALAQGSHTFRVRATDPAANRDPTPAQHAWTVDLAAPDTTIGTRPDNPTNDRTATFTFSATESGSTFQCKLDAGAFAACTSPTAYTALADGVHAFSVRARDPAGNVDATPATYTWTVDVTGPQTTITSFPADPTTSTSASFTFTSSEPGSTFECRLDAASFAPCVSPIAYASLAEGAHTFRARATDASHNTDGSPAAYTWSIDLTAPQTTILSTPASQTNDQTASFAFSSSEPGSTFECRLDGAATFTPCVSPKTYAGLAEGAHTFRVRARDAAGNIDATPDTHAWTIDIVAPDTTILSGPPERTTSPGATLSFSATEAGSTFECRLDDAPFAACTSPVTYGSLAEGPHTFRVRATDPAGNVDASPAVRTWTIDVTPPQTTLVSTPADPTNDRGASFAFTSNEPGSTFRCSLDTAAFDVCSSPKAYTAVPEGVHTFRVQAVDSVGNTDASPATVTWRIDTTPPDTAVSSGPPDPTNLTTAAIAFTATEAGSTFECRLDAAAFAACTAPAVMNDLADGPHTFRVRATDRAGNVDTTPASRTWTVETRPPTTRITSGPSVLAASASAAFVLAADEPVARFECRLDAAASFTSCPSTVTYTQLAEGSHTFRARAVDVAGNVGPETSRTWTIDTTAPDTTITSGPPSTIDRGDATFDFAATDAAARFECALDGAAFASCASPLVLTGLPDGPHSLRVRSADVAGNVDSSPAAYDWTVSRPPPMPPPAPPAEPDRVPPSEVRGASARAGDGRVTIRWTTPADPDFERVAVVRVSPGKSVRTRPVYEGSGTAVVDRGLTNGVRYRYRITARDRAGNSSAGVEVAATPQAPLIAPRNGASVSAPPLLIWQPRPRATYYNVQLWLVRTGGQQQAAKPVKVLSAWPSTPRLKLNARWVYLGKTYRLVPGSYRWFVFPGFGKRSQAQYGALVGQSAFTVKGKKAL
jgi:hypothetical protein